MFKKMKILLKEINDFNGVVDIRVETSLKGDINE